MHAISGGNVYLFFIAMCVSIQNFYSSSAAAKNSKKNIVTPQYLEHLLNTNRIKKFTKILQIPNTDLVDPSQRKTVFQEAYDYNGMNYSDILMRPGQVLNADQHFEFNGILNLKINTWKNGIVPYYITNTFFDNETSQIKDEIEESNQKLGPNVNFRPYQDGDKDYVVFYKGGCGCYSNLGNVGGPQAISLIAPCFPKGFVLHELQHTLGIAHETNRFDRDDYIRLIHENIPEVLVSMYERYNAESFVNVGPFNYHSLMSLFAEVPGFGLKVYDILQEDFDYTTIDDHLSLTPTDIQRIKTIYK